MVNYTKLAGVDVFDNKVEEETRVHNNEMNLAWQFIASTSMSVFLTGKAGTGKTTFLRRLRELTPKRMVVLAPTGVAAINAQGQTIHSFFQLPFGPNVPNAQSDRRSFYKMGKDKKNLIRTLDLLVIDEISMVRCDLLDAVDQELRKYRDRNKPFGGVQLLLIGDLQQLAPVARDAEWQLLSPYYSTPYFFGSRALQQTPYVTVELKHIYRQQDENFINILGKIREGQADQHCVDVLNSRFVPNFVPPADDDWIRLTTHNRMAQDYNIRQLEQIKAPVWNFHAVISKNFPESNYPAEVMLTLKVGAQVMFIKNDPSGSHAYYNGKIGVVRGYTPASGNGDEDCIQVYCKEDNQTIYVPRVKWENTKYTIDPDTGDIREVVDGTFEQYPLRLAWAITVHKSQGLTFEHAVVDINDSFAHGQVYVALSRCRTLEGMVLARPMAPQSIIVDAAVNSYIDKELQSAQTTAGKLPQLRYDYYMSLLDELFNFNSLKGDLTYLTRIVDEHLYKTYPELLVALKELYAKVDAEIVNVSMRFQMQYHQLMQQSVNFVRDKLLAQRLSASAEYFAQRLSTLFVPVLGQTTLQIGNKTVSTQYNNALDALKLSYRVKHGIFQRLASQPFSVRNYLDFKAKATLDEIGKAEPTKKSVTDGAASTPKEKKPAPKKGDSQKLSFQMYRQGKSIKEIATERNLTTSTVESHLATFVASGELDINELVPVQHQKFIQGVVRSFDKSFTLSDVKNLLPDTYTYMEVKLVLAQMDKQQ